MAKEYVPFEAYGLLRRIVDKGPQRVRSRHVTDDEPVRYLVSRGLAKTSGNGEQVENTHTGRSVGQIDWDPPTAAA